MPEVAENDTLTLGEADDGKLFVVRVINMGEERVARYHHCRLARRKLRFPCFADSDRPEDYRGWLHAGWGACAIRRVSP